MTDKRRMKTVKSFPVRSWSVWVLAARRDSLRTDHGICATPQTTSKSKAFQAYLNPQEISPLIISCKDEIRIASNHSAPKKFW